MVWSSGGTPAPAGPYTLHLVQLRTVHIRRQRASCIAAAPGHGSDPRIRSANRSIACRFPAELPPNPSSDPIQPSSTSLSDRATRALI